MDSRISSGVVLFHPVLDAIWQQQPQDGLNGTGGGSGSFIFPASASVVLLGEAWQSQGVVHHSSSLPAGGGDYPAPLSPIFKPELV